jgi:hypothetical protein
MTMTCGSLASSDEIGGEARQIEHEIIEYLERHQRDLPPEVRIILERQFLGPSSGRQTLHDLRIVARN